MTKKIVMLLHGVGSSGSDLERLGDYWAPSMPGVMFLSPNAPFPFDHGGGYQWFSLDGINEINRPSRVQDARVALDKTLNDLLLQHGGSWQTDEIILVGFSQGTIMSMDVLASSRLPVRAIVGFSGRLSSPQPYNIDRDVPVLLIHGQGDPVIPYSETEKAAATLEAAGVEVSTFLEPGIPHTISQAGADKAAVFIRQQFGFA
ncbi:alpha/beta hydrolase [Vibrio furnissii]|uniref:alpha/beta hydrolase n=1 Tax=Vibrio furnissii TaxID=29494 RepID=UPI000200DB17|nr:dienelactone hydrolase family protein [Vibrio furnissii]ADT89654.1 phospholipase/Carboxylesterase [Vibrio furnissii NCTC 11218]